MKKKMTMLVVALVLLGQPLFGSGLVVVKKALLRFEANVKWSAVSASWRSTRSGWINRLYNASTPRSIATQLRVLESNIKWSAVSSAWSGIRPAWVNRTRSATRAKQVAALLLRLESNTKWSAVQNAWKGIRSGWISRLQGVQDPM